MNDLTKYDFSLLKRGGIPQFTLHVSDTHQVSSFSAALSVEFNPNHFFGVDYEHLACQVFAHLVLTCQGQTQIFSNYVGGKTRCFINLGVKWKEFLLFDC